MATNNITFPIYNADGTPFNGLVLRNATFDSIVMSLGDKITGDVYYIDNTLAVTMSEYIEYKRNEDSEVVKFVLVNPPTVVREGIVSDNSELHGMTKYSFTFYHPMCQVSNFPFTDVAVSSNEEKFRSDSKTFAWSGNLFDMVVKLNKNLQGTQWVVGTNIEHYEQDGVTETSMWQKAAKIPDEPLSFDKTYVSEVLKTSYETWKIPFVVDQIAPTDARYAQGKRFLILFGTPSNEILDNQGQPYIFRFGQGVGLKNNSRTPKNNKIVTRIIGYGSENNIPYGYPQIPWYGDQTWKYTVNNDSSAVGSLPIYKGVLGGRYVNLIKHTFTRKTLMPSVYTSTLFNKVSPYLERTINPNEGEPLYNTALNDYLSYLDQIIASSSSSIEKNAFGALKKVLEEMAASPTPSENWYTKKITGSGYEGTVSMNTGRYVSGFVEWTTESGAIQELEFDDLYAEVVGHVVGDLIPNPDFDPTIELVDYYDADGSYVNPVVEGAESVEIHQFDDIKPEFTQNAIINAFAYSKEHENDMQFSALIAYITTCYNNAKSEKEKEALFSLIDNLPYIPDSGFQFLAIEGSYTCEAKASVIDKYYLKVTFTSPDLNFTKQSIRNGVTPAPVEWNDSLKPDSDEYVQSYFKMTLPQLDFDLYACASITEEMKINMRSGACIGCTFDIYVDWDDYKANFYDSDGNFAPDGEQRDLTKYPKTNLGQVTFVVKKDLDTFGTLMPNTYQQPHSGDEFVILGISLPTTYVTNAEARLDDAAKEYMRENNVHYYDYPLKFDEHFLATHTDILSQIRNNTIVRFQYGGELPMALYVKQITVKYSGVLPTYDITLTDDVEIVLNQIGQVTDDVSRMRVQVSELQKYYSENIIKTINEKLSKAVDDVCQGRITFQQGLDSIGSTIFHDELRSPDFASGLYTGRGWRVDKLGNAEFESMRVRSYLEIVELLVNRMQAQEGDTVFSDNDQIEMVDEVQGQSGTTYVLSLKAKYNGYVNAQRLGYILRGVINTVAAKDAGISEVTTGQAGQFFTSWMEIVQTHNESGDGDDVNLDTNQIRVKLYEDDYYDEGHEGEPEYLHHITPAGKNFKPCELMTIARWGCTLDPNQSGISDYEKKRRIAARSTFYVSTSEGRIVKLNDVSSPILTNDNYGTTLGILPDFVQRYTSIAPRIASGRDYLYAQGVVVQDFVKIDRNGNVVSEGNTEKEKTIYKWADTKPATPTGTNIPPAGWSESPDVNFETIEIQGQDVGQDTKTVRRIDFFTTEDNATLTLNAKVSSEENYDFLIIGKLDNDDINTEDAYTLWSDCNDSTGLYYVVAISGTATRDYTFTVPKAGKHYVYVAYVQDSSGTAGDNKGVVEYVNSVNVTPAKHLWASKGDLVNGALSGSWSEPIQANGVDGVNGQDGQDGQDGARGKVGRFFYYAGDFSLQDQTNYVINDAQAPYFSHVSEGQTLYHVFNRETNPSGGTMTTSQMWTECGGFWNNAPWEVMTNDFKYIITEAIFGSYAHFGGAIINGDFMLSQYGTINGVESTTYTSFDANHPNDNTGSNFIPYYCVNLRTGETYQNKAVVRGVINATAIYQKYQNDVVQEETVDPSKGSAIIIPNSYIGNNIYLPSASSYDYLTLTFYRYFPASTIQTIARICASGNDLIYTNTELKPTVGQYRKSCKSFYPAHNLVIKLHSIGGQWCLDCDESKLLAFYDENENQLEVV